MPDWKSIVRDRIASLRLEGAAESDLTEEFSQHLEDRYGEFRSRRSKRTRSVSTKPSRSWMTRIRCDANSQRIAAS